MKRTKIIATIGPASEKVEVLEKMIEAGMDAARLNFSHGSYSHHAMLVSNIRKAAESAGKPVAIIQDLQGARVRVGNVSKDGVAVAKDETIILVDEKKARKPRHLAGAQGKRIIPVTYPAIAKTIKKGHEIYIDDKAVELVAEKIRADYIECRSKRDGLIKTHKGINFPHSKVALPTILTKDKQDIEFGIKSGVDFIALSFVRSAGDVRRLRKLIRKFAGAKNAERHKIIVKIERPEAIKCFGKILKEADAAMVARGDLGIELPPEDVPIIQKDIIALCLEQAKPVIVATQMLESMTSNLNPTRAEASDVANAVIDHADAVMLSGETANGKYPVETVEMMRKIIERAENSTYDDLVVKGNVCGFKSSDLAIGVVANILAEGANVKAVLAVSPSGETARAVSRFRPELPIIAATENAEVRQHLMLNWGVFPILTHPIKNVPAFSKNIIKSIQENGILKKRDKVLVIKADNKGRNTVEVEEA